MGRISSCRSCGYTKLESILVLGSIPLANAFVLGENLDAEEYKFPIKISFLPE